MKIESLGFILKEVLIPSIERAHKPIVLHKLMSLRFLRDIFKSIQSLPN